MPFLFQQTEGHRDTTVTPAPGPSGRFLFESEPVPRRPALDAVQSNPDQAAKTQKLSRETGIPKEAVKGNEKQLEAQQRVDELFTITNDTPFTNNWISDPDNAEVAHDDVETLSSFERLANSWERGTTLVELGRAGTQLRSAPNDPRYQTVVDSLQQRLQEMGQDTEGGFIGYLGPAFEAMGQMVEMFSTPEAFRNVGVGAATGLGVGMAGGPLAPITTPVAVGTGLTAGIMGHSAWESYNIEGGNFYLEAIDQGIDKEAAGLLSHVVGVANASLETVSLGVFLKPFGQAGKTLLKQGFKNAMKRPRVVAMATKFTSQYGASIIAETGTEVLQEVVNIVGEEIGKELTDTDLEAATEEEIADRLEEVAIKAFQAATVLGAPGPAINAAVQYTNAKKAESNGETLDEMHQMLLNSNLAQRDPDKLAEAASGIMEAADIRDVFIDGEKLADWLAGQENFDEVLSGLGIQQDLDEASVLGTDVKLSGDKFGRFLLTHPNFSELSDDVRTTEGGMTRREAMEFEAAGLREEIADLVANQELEQPGSDMTNPVIVPAGHTGRFAVMNDDNRMVGQFDTVEDAETFIEQQQNPPFEPSVDIAQEELGLKQFFNTAVEAGMTNKQYEEYVNDLRRAKNRAILEQQDKVFRQQQRELETEWNQELEREREVAREQLSNDDTYAAFHGIGAVRLNRAQVKEVLDLIGRSLDDLPTQDKGRKIYTTTKSEPVADLNMHAELYGFPDGQSFLAHLLNKPRFQDAVQNLAYERMLEKHGDIREQHQAILEARKSLHNEEQLGVITTELNALRTAIKEKRVTKKMLKQAAKEYMGTQSIRRITPSKFLQAERRAAQKARKALRQGDLQAATRFKFQQALNHEAFALASQTQERVGKQRKKLEKFNRDRKTHRNMPHESLQAIRELLSNVSFTARRRDATTGSLEAVANDKIDPVQLSMDPDQRKDYRDMTLDEWDNLVSDVEAIAHKGRQINKLRDTAVENALSEVVSDVVTNLNTNLSKKRAKKVIKEHRGTWNNLKTNAKELATMAFNMDTVVRMMDGWKDLGPVYINTKGRIDRALAQGYHPGQIGYLRRQQQEAKKVKELFDIFTLSERKNMNALLDIPGLENKKISHHTVLVVLLNSGNQGNLDAMIEGGTFTSQEVAAIQEYASQKDWQFAQSVWDYFDSFWPEVAEAQKRRTNAVPKKVEPLAIETAHGTFSGGYFPIRYDVKKSVMDIFSADNVNDLIQETRFGNFASSHTRRGHTLNRTGQGVGPISLDLFAIHTHVDQLIYDLEVGDAITDFYKVWFSKDTRQAFIDADAMHYWEYGELWLRDAITQEVGASNALEKGLRHLRTGFTVQKLALNVGVAVTQIAGVAQTSVVIGRRHTWKGLSTFLGAPWTGQNNIFDVVSQQSGFMATRQDNWHKDVLDAQKAVSQLKLLDRITPGKSAEFMREAAFWGIKKVQMLTDMITWLGGYSKGVEQFNDHNKAVDYADRAVARSQASGVFTERTAAERGTIHKGMRQNELVRSFTPLISYFAAKNNIAYERTKQTKFLNPGNTLVWAWDMATLYVIDVMIAGILTGQMPMGDDAEEGDAIKWIAEQSVGSLAGGIVGVREAVSEARGYAGGGVLGALFNYFGRASEQISQGEMDEAMVKSVSDLSGIFLKWPSSFINKELTNINRANRGDEVSPAEWIFGPKYKER